MLKLGIVADEISHDFREAVNIGLQADIRRYEIRFLQSGRAPLCEERELREIERIRRRPTLRGLTSPPTITSRK